MYDRGFFWRRVQHDWEQLTELAPEGYHVETHVYLVGVSAPVQPDFVESSREADVPWLRFQLGGPPDVPDMKLMHIHESAVLRVEVVIVHTSSEAPKRPIGFSVGELSPDPD